MLTSARVPPNFQAVFELAEGLVKKQFADIKFRLERGTMHIGGERYVLVRAESLYMGLLEAMTSSLGEEAAVKVLYCIAREIGRSDAMAFISKSGLSDGSDGIARLASGPVHFAYTGWAFVEIFEDSRPVKDNTYFLHYSHPNTFESENFRVRNLKSSRCACFFSAGYSAGWCTNAFGLEVDAREIRCLARGDSLCEFIMAPPRGLDEYESRLLNQA